MIQNHVNLINLILFSYCAISHAQIPFSQQLPIQETITDNATAVYAADLDDDGDKDILSASAQDGKIAWYENLGGGIFGPQRVISSSDKGAISVYAADLDGDGDIDVLSAAESDNAISWYENSGGGSFGTRRFLTVYAKNAKSVYATDLDADGDMDVLSASRVDNKVAWYENMGGGHSALNRSSLN